MHALVRTHTDGGRIPITVVGGPARAGKTTLLHRLLEHNDGRRLVVVRDASEAMQPREAGGPGDLVSSHPPRNGSVCLTAESGIETALYEAKQRTPAPQHVIIEMRAGIDPKRTAGYGYMPGYRPGGMVVVVNASSILSRMHEQSAEPDFAAYLRCAELLVANHVDGLSVAARRLVRRWLTARAPNARIVETERCALPTAFVLGVDGRSMPSQTVVAPWTPNYAVDTHPRRGLVWQPRSGDDYRAWYLTAGAPIDERAFREWVSELPESILRGEGVIHLRGEPRCPFSFHLCGSRWSLTREARQTEGENSWLTLVGVSTTSRRGMSGDEGAAEDAGIGAVDRSIATVPAQSSG